MRKESESLDLDFEIEELCYKHLCNYITDAYKAHLGGQNDVIKTPDIGHLMQTIVDFIKTNYEAKSGSLYRRKRN